MTQPNTDGVRSETSLSAAWESTVSKGSTFRFMTGRKSKKTKMFSPTQVDILKHLARDEDYETVAQELNMSTDGIKYHLGQMRLLLNMKSLHAIIALAIVAGVLTNNQWPIDSTGDLFIDL